MSSEDCSALLKDLQNLENSLRESDKWESFSRGIMKEAHRVLEADEPSQDELVILFSRFVDERARIIFHFQYETEQKCRVLERQSAELGQQLVQIREEKKQLLQMNKKLQNDNERLASNSQQLCEQIAELERLKSTNGAQNLVGGGLA